MHCKGAVSQSETRRRGGCPLFMVRRADPTGLRRRSGGAAAGLGWVIGARDEIFFREAGEEEREGFCGERHVWAVVEDEDGAWSQVAEGEGGEGLGGGPVDEVTGHRVPEDDLLTALGAPGAELGGEVAVRRADPVRAAAGEPFEEVVGAGEFVGDDGEIVHPGIDVRPGVVAELMAAGSDVADEVRMFLGLLADDEEGGPEIVAGEFVEDFWRLIGGGTVVEGEGDGVVVRG